MQPKLSDATAAEEFARGQGLVAANKKRPGVTKGGIDRERRRKAADDELDRVRIAADAVKDGREEQAEALARLAIEKHVGNCEEQATVAYLYLVARRVAPVWLLALEEPGDHVFVGLGEIAEVGDLDKWGPDTFICDPWANIACKSGEYRAAWAAKLTKWAGDGKTLRNPTLEYINPLDDDWFQAINKHKIKVLLRYPAPD
ncbi:MAG: putative type effector protein [Gemmataceae bacterium]|nr:putative type effector protein [Gemmataceae bacterium]